MHEYNGDYPVAGYGGGNNYDGSDDGAVTSVGGIIQNSVIAAIVIVLSNNMKSGSVNGNVLENIATQTLVAGILLGSKDGLKEIARKERFSKTEASLIGNTAVMGGAMAAMAAAKGSGGNKISDAVVASFGGALMTAMLMAGGIKLVKQAGSFVGRLNGQNENQENIGRGI